MLDLPTLNNSNNNNHNNKMNNSNNNLQLNYQTYHHMNPTQTQSTSSLSTFQSSASSISCSSTSSNYAKLRSDSHSKSSSNSSSTSTSTSTTTTTTVPPISHATRIPQTNLSYKELLHQHQFTPSGGSSSTSPMKQSFETLNLNDIKQQSNHNNHNNNNKIEQSLELQREAFLRKPIIEEPKKSVTGYQLFAKWKKAQKLENNGYSANNKSLSTAWNELTQSQKEEWNKKSDQAKMRYNHEKERWQKYVQEAKTLGIPIPTKSVKSLIPPIKIKNLLNLIPDICKYNKEAQFIISKATEMFIQFHTEKAIQISTKMNAIQSENNDNNEDDNDNSMEQTQLIISGQHCFDAMQTDHKFNFLRAVTVKPINKNTKNKRKKTNIKRGVKRKLESTEPQNLTSSENSVKSKKSKSSSPSKKKRKLNNDSEKSAKSENITNNTQSTQIVNNGHYHPRQQPHIAYNNYINGYSANGAYPVAANTYYQHQYYQQQQQQQQSQQQGVAPTATFPSIPTIPQNNPNPNPNLNGSNPANPANPYQPPPFQPNTFFNPHPLNHINTNPSHHVSSNGNSQIVNVQQIFGDD